MKMILDIVDAAQTKVHYRLIFFLPTFTLRKKETPFPTTTKPICCYAAFAKFPTSYKKCCPMQFRGIPTTLSCIYSLICILKYCRRKGVAIPSQQQQ